MSENHVLMTHFGKVPANLTKLCFTWFQLLSRRKAKIIITHNAIANLHGEKHINYGSVSQPPGRVPVPGLGGLLTGTLTIFLKLKKSLNSALIRYISY